MEAAEDSRLKEEGRIKKSKKAPRFDCWLLFVFLNSKFLLQSLLVCNGFRIFLCRHHRTNGNKQIKLSQPA